ncbi:hypothetical protein GCM10027160_52380 [Streptomyces calidiresistens]
MWEGFHHKVVRRTKGFTLVAYVAMLDTPARLCDTSADFFRPSVAGSVLQGASGTRVDRLARDFGVSTATAYRRLHEGITVLATQARACTRHSTRRGAPASGMSSSMAP